MEVDSAAFFAQCSHKYRALEIRKVDYFFVTSLFARMLFNLPLAHAHTGTSERQGNDKSCCCYKVDSEHQNQFPISRNIAS